MATEEKSTIASAGTGGGVGEMPEGRLRTFLIFGAVGVLAAIVFGLLYLFVIAPAAPGSSMGWFLFSFATGITMIIMPCTLPLAFVIVPLAMGKGLFKGISMALAFGLGVAVTQSLYGVAAALIGGLAINSLGAPLESVKNWVYLIAGIFALTFALAEIGLTKFHMPTYKGSAPAFIQKRKDAFKAFLLGLFLGNIGIGCPHPATPLLLIEVASSGNVLYGWLMFLVHAIGRILPLLLLAFMGILGVNGLNWLVQKKDAVERASGWAMVFVAGFILTLGLFTHDWWVNSGIHSMLEKVTQESYFNARFNDMLNSSVAHVHGLEAGPGMFGLPLWLGHWFLVTVWILPIWWWWLRKRRTLLSSPAFKIQALEHKIDKLEAERRQIESMVALDDVEVDLDLKTHQIEMDRLEKLRREAEEKVQFAEKGILQSPIARSYEIKMLYVQRNYLLIFSVFIILTFAYFLPTNFYLASIAGVGHGTADHHAAAPAPAESMGDMMLRMGTKFSTSLVDLNDAVPTETVELQDGDSYDVTAGYVKKEVGNRLLRMLAYNGSIPGPFIKAPQGSTITINFKNETDIDQTIHSHGVRVGNLDDGVPDVTQKVVPPGGSHTYTINFVDAGIFWFHPHTRDDYGQEMGLYGSYIVEPLDPEYYSPVDKEVPLVIDDILIEDDRIAAFYKEFTTHALLGRFGNEYLINGTQNYLVSANEGDVVRLLITNVSNARTYALSIPGAKMKLVASDASKYERETYADSIQLSPAERSIVEVYFEKSGAYALTHTYPKTPSAPLTTETLATFAVAEDPDAPRENVEAFMTLRTNEEVTASMAGVRELLTKSSDKRVRMSVALMGAGAVDHSGHGHAAAPTTPAATTGAVDHSQHAHGAVGATAGPAIQWDDVGNTDAKNTSHHVTWKLIDQDTGLENMAINWKFRKDTLAKITFFNDPAAEHVMQHPIHFHGQRFVVLARNGVPNDNLVWKDTAIVLPGETVDLVVDMSNSGSWMAHCHISEHLHAGMMLNFRVEDENGVAAGDEFRATLPPAQPQGHMMPDGTMMQGSMPMTSAPTLGLATSSLSFTTPIPVSNYTVTPSRKFIGMGRVESIGFEITDRSGTSVQLSKDMAHPLTVTFVKSDDRIKVRTYPGNLDFSTPIPPAVPAQPTMPMQGDGHEHLHMLPFNVAYADEGAAHVHPESAMLKDFTYAVPIQLPEKGVYRAFVQFVPVGGSEVRMAAFDIEVGSAGWSVDNYGWSKEKKWWILLIVSLLLMTPLSFFVRRYIGKE